MFCDSIVYIILIMINLYMFEMFEIIDNIPFNTLITKYIKQSFVKNYHVVFTYKAKLASKKTFYLCTKDRHLP